MKDLAEVLRHYGINGQVEKINQGPLVTQIEFRPEAGTKTKSIAALLPDVARELGVASLRLEPVSRSGNLGFEIPSEEMKTVDFSRLSNSEEFYDAAGALPLALGVDIAGRPVVADLAKMPHLLVAGTTGSGKSVGLNTFILSLIKKKSPKDLKLVLIDPKRIEFSVYNNLSYLLLPVVTDNTKAAAVLQYLAEEMERRYTLLEKSRTKNIEEYNLHGGQLPYIVCVIDEFADLAAANKKTAATLQLLAQKARASGIHIILATQRPSVDVVTGVLKANFPSRLAYKVASAADSRTILDTAGAEDLIGRGDALFLAADGRLQRIHGAYATDEEIAAVLSPYRADVQDLLLAANEKQQPSKPEKSWLRRIWDFWTSLRQKDKKALIGVVTWIAAMVVGKSKRR